jgi:hypothetical protein
LKRTLLLVVTVVTMVLCVSGFAFAGEVNESDNSFSFSVHANQNQLQKIEALWNKSITEGEFLKEVFPSEYEKMPEQLKAYADAREMAWPKKPSQIKEAKQAKEVVAPDAIVVVRKDSSMDVSGSIIDFESYSEVWLPVGYKMPLKKRVVITKQPSWLLLWAPPLINLNVKKVIMVESISGRMS